MAQDPSLQEMTLRQLRNQAMQLEISRYSRMSKTQLIQSIREARADLFGISKETVPDPQEQEKVASTKFHAGGAQDRVKLADVDAELGELPGGYGRSRIVLLPRDPNWAYAYWDIPHEDKESLRQQGGQQLALRLFDVSDLDAPLGSSTMQEYPCTEVDREWYLPIPISDRSYEVEIGYRTVTGEWLTLARSAAITVPPSHPSDWIQDQFVSVAFDQSLQGKTVYQLERPPLWSVASTGTAPWLGSFPEQMSGLAELVDHLPGSLGPWRGSGLGLSRGVEILGWVDADTQVSVGDQPIAQSEDGSFELTLDADSMGSPQIVLRVDGETKGEIHLRLET